MHTLHFNRKNVWSINAMQILCHNTTLSKMYLSGTVRVPQPMEEDWKFSTLIFWLWDVSTTYVYDIRPKSFTQISFVCSKSKEMCY